MTNHQMCQVGDILLLDNVELKTKSTISAKTFPNAHKDELQRNYHYDVSNKNCALTARIKTNSE